MIKIKRKIFLESTKKPFEYRAVLNPAVVERKGVEHMFYRAVAKNGISSVGYAQIIDDKIERLKKPIIVPTEKYEIRGIEDPRVTKIGNTYYMIYTAFNGKDARIAYAVSKNLKDWKKKGIISPNISVNEARKIVKIKVLRDKWKTQEIVGSRVCLWDKDGVLFPEKINGKFVMLHRFLPDIQIVKFKDFEELKDDNFWREYIKNLSESPDQVSLYRRYEWENQHIGAGAVPIKTKKGWLLIYHGVELEKGVKINLYNKMMYHLSGIFQRLRNDRLPLVYRAGAALLDLKNPEVELTRLKKPLFSPEYDWEKKGDINNVVFPESALVKRNKLKIYYGCSDKRIGLAEINFKELMQQFRNY